MTGLPGNIVRIACGDEFFTASGEVTGFHGDVVSIGCVDKSFTGSGK